MVTKWCSYCKSSKDIEEFSRNKHQKSGLNTVCRSCDSLRHKLYREKNKVSMNEKAAHYYTLNREIILEKGKERYRKDPQKHLIKWNQQRATKLKATPSWANKVYIAMFYKLAKEETLRTGRLVEVDHIIPLKSNLVCGLHVEHNLQLLFKEDNRKKGNRFING